MRAPLALILLLISGCSSFRPLVFVPMDPGALPEGRARTVAVSYAGSVFQERFMSVTGIVGFVLFAGPLDLVTAGQAGATETLNTAVYTPQQRTASRHEHSEYEKLLADFDVHADFNSVLSEGIEGVARLDASIAIDPSTNGLVIDVLKTPALKDCTKNPIVLGEDLRERLGQTNAPCVLGLKLSYGLGARAGREQFGFSKSYRPFVKLIGILLDTESGKILWRHYLIVFSEDSYRGSDADVENLDGAVLAQQFKVINRKLAAMLVDGLNGKVPPAPEPLVGLSSDLDFEF